MSTRPTTRDTQLQELLKEQPRFRLQQIREALYRPAFKAWDDVSNLPKSLREELKSSIPFISVTAKAVMKSERGDTYKAILTLADDHEIESVLMANARGYWTICVSSQVGCAMRCGFCATGRMGFTRNLSADEIGDQYRFWTYFLADHPDLEQRISNIVFMGMGEPMANYQNVKQAILTWLEKTDLGRTRITVSTVGVIPRLEHLLNDPEWPHVRLAISLHSAEQRTRKEIVPTSYDDFLPALTHWAQRYLKKFGNRRHYLTFEYVMLRDVNDTDKHAAMLANYVNKIGDVRVNLIPYNLTDNPYQRSFNRQIDVFKKALEDKGVTVTVRKTMGDDIAAACGQLIKLGEK